MHLGIIDHSARDRALRVVDDDLGRHAPEVTQRAVMSALPGLGALVEDKFNVLMPGKAQRHREETGASLGAAIGVCQHRTGAEAMRKKKSAITAQMTGSTQAADHQR
jgi:hypothetical protein